MFELIKKVQPTTTKIETGNGYTDHIYDKILNTRYSEYGV